MANSISATITDNLTVVESLADASLGSGVNKVTHSAFNTNKSLTSASTPAVAETSAFEKTLTGSTTPDTINLNALTIAGGAAYSATGKKIVGAKFINKVGNTAGHTISIAVGASNGNLMAGAGWKVTLGVGDYASFFVATIAGAIGTGATHLIDVVGGANDVLQVILIFG